MIATPVLELSAEHSFVKVYFVGYLFPSSVVSPIQNKDRKPATFEQV
jgi:hypothetical protein